MFGGGSHTAGESEGKGSGPGSVPGSVTPHPLAPRPPHSSLSPVPRPRRPPLPSPRAGAADEHGRGGSCALKIKPKWCIVVRACRAQPPMAVTFPASTGLGSCEVTAPWLTLATPTRNGLQPSREIPAPWLIYHTQRPRFLPFTLLLLLLLSLLLLRTAPREQSSDAQLVDWRACCPTAASKASLSAQRQAKPRTSLLAPSRSPLTPLRLPPPCGAVQALGRAP